MKNWIPQHSQPRFAEPWSYLLIMFGQEQWGNILWQRILVHGKNVCAIVQGCWSQNVWAFQWWRMRYINVFHWVWGLRTNFPRFCTGLGSPPGTQIKKGNFHSESLSSTHITVSLCSQVICMIVLLCYTILQSFNLLPHFLPFIIFPPNRNM